MKKHKKNILPGGKFDFRLVVLSLALLVTMFNLNILAQNTASQVGANVLETKQYDADRSEENENINKKLYSINPSMDLLSAATYAFAPATAALEDMSTGTTQLVAPGLDDTASAVTNIGFDFWYDGVRYTQFSVNANGLARLGAAAVSTSFDNASATGFATTTNAPKIAPYYDDIWIGTNGNIRSKVVGAVGSRKLIVEWNNMTIPRQSAATTGAATFQMWIYESAHPTTPGVIQFVYGNGMVINTVQGGYTIGLQSGAATNLASVTTATNTISYSAANNTQTDAITTGKSYIFTPNVPTAPTGLTFTAINSVGLTLNWTDNATNEVGYVIYRSLDGVNYSFLAQTAANATSYADMGLASTTTYFYQVYAVTEGALSSPVLAGSQATTAPGNDTCAGAGGNYSAPTTWADGTVPNAGDNVTIQAGCTVTVDTTTATALSLTIASGGSLTAVPGTTITVGGDLINNGTLDLSPTNAATGAGLVFTGANSNVFGGTGAINDVLTITVNKGTSSANVLDVTATNFTVQGVTTDVAGFLTLTNGTFKVSGTFTVTNRTFAVPAYTIPATAGFWLNNPNYTVAGQAGSSTEAGLLRITQGIFNIGTGTGNSMGFSSGSTVIVEGGTVNATGRFGVAAAGNVFTYNQSAGTVTVNTVGNASTTLGSFDLGTSASSSITISGGTIVVQLATTIDYRNQAGSGITGVTGGTLQLGNANSGAAKAFNIRGVVPNLVITNTSGNHTATWGAPATYNNISLNITINTGNTLTLGNQIFLFAGAVLTNNGTLTSIGTSARFITFSSTVAQSYTGSGVVTAPMNSFELQSDLGFTFDPSIPQIVTNRVIIFVGNLVNSNKLTVGSGGASTAIVQIGNTTTPTAAGTFDQPLTFNPGTGGIVISYLRTTASRVTGGEIPTTRSITNLSYDDDDPTHTLTVAGGDLTVTGTLTLTNGIVLTGTNTLIHNGTAARTNGFVAGNLSRSYTAVGAYTYFVGDNTGTPEFSPMTATVTALGTNPSSLKVSVVDDVLPGLDPAQSASRYWRLTENGDLTADLSFNYVAADIAGDASTYKVFKRDGGAPALVPNSSTGTNPATATGVSDFSDWGIGNLAPTAAGVDLGGRVKTATGRGIARARVYLTDSQGNTTMRQTNPAGYYRFADVAAGSNYILTVEHKSYSFQPAQLLFISDENLGMDFVAAGTNLSGAATPPDKQK